MLKALSGPLSRISFCPTGGINPENYKDYLALDSVRCVGGSWVAPINLVREQKWADITGRCRALAA